MPGQGAANAAQRVDPGRGDDASPAVAGLPDLREHELQERKPAGRSSRGGRQLAHQRIRFETESVGGGGAGDGLAEIFLREATQKVQRAGNQLTETRQRRDRSEEVVARGCKEPDALVAGAQLGEGGGDRRRFLAPDGDELFELIDEDDEAPVVSQLARDLAHEARGIFPQALLCVVRTLRGERPGECSERPPSRNQPGDAEGAGRSQRSLADGRDDAGEAKGGLADAGIGGDEEERLGPQSLDDRQAIAAAPEEHRAVLGLERLQAAVGISLGDWNPAPRPRALERVEQIVGGREPLLGVAAQAAIHRGSESGMDARHERGERRRIAFYRGQTDQVRRDVVEGRTPRRQFESEDAEGIEIGTDGQFLPAPGLGGDVVRRADHRPFRLVLHGRAGQEQTSEPEIDDLDLSVVGDEDVFGIQIAVQDAAAVGGDETAGEVASDLEYARKSHGPLDRPERPALDVLGNEVRSLLHASDPVERRDVRVLDARGRPRFDEKAFERFAIRRGDEFHRYQPVEERVLGEVDLGLGALSERPQKPVLPELGGERREGSRPGPGPVFRCRQFHGARSGKGLDPDPDPAATAERSG